MITIMQRNIMKTIVIEQEQYDNLSSDYKKSQFNLVSYKAGLELVEARLAHYKKNEAVFEESINVLKLEVRLRDNALNEYKMNLEKAEAKRDQLKQTLEKFRNSSKSLNNILESQVIDKFKTRLGYDAATAASLKVESFVNLTDKSGSDKGYHLVPPPLTGNIIHCKPDLTFMDEIVKSENLDVTTVVTPCNDKIVENKGVSNSVESNAVRSGKLSTAGVAVNTVRPVNTANTKAVNTVRPVNTANTKAVNTVGDEVVHKELGNRMERAATTFSSFKAEQDSDFQTRFETTSVQSNDPPLSKVNTFGGGEDNLKLMELMAHCTKLYEFVRKKNREKWYILLLLDEVTTVRLQVSTARPNLVLLVESEGSEGFHEIIDVLTSSHIYYALTECPTLYLSLIEQFWQTAVLSTTEDGVHAITATIDGRDKIITGCGCRRRLETNKEGYSSALTKLVLKVKKLEKQVKSGKARRRARIVLSEDEDAAKHPSKQGRKIA
ncbi:hypothetical protein Tco_1195067 [Tanacetum coccineum]